MNIELLRARFPVLAKKTYLNTGSYAPLALEVDERTRLVARSEVCYRNGSRLDVAGIVRIAHARGSWVLLGAV